MCQSEIPDPAVGLSSPDPVVREAYLMSHDYIDYVTSGGVDGTMGPAPTVSTAALRHAGDELLVRFPLFFRRWPRVFRDVTEKTAIPTLMSILDQHFFPPVSGGRRRDLAWSAVLSVYVLAGQMALHCKENGLEGVLPQLKESTGSYVEQVICPEIRDKGGWSGFVSRFGPKRGLESKLKTLCCWSLLALAVSILAYCIWKNVARTTVTSSGHTL